MQKYKNIWNLFCVSQKSCIFATSKIISGTIPQARKVCCFCIRTYELRYNNNIPH